MNGFRLLPYPQIQSCATCSEWRVVGDKSVVHPEDVRCPLQPEMTGHRMTKKVCDLWHSEYLNDFVTCQMYYRVLFGLEPAEETLR